jgi:hypothetical protein
MKGSRKLLFGFVCLLFLAGGLWLCLRPELAEAGKVLFPAFAAAVVGVVGAVVAGNVGEHVATTKAAASAALTREEIDKRVRLAIAAQEPKA